MCGKYKYLPFKITEVEEDGDWVDFKLCLSCSESYMEEPQEPQETEEIEIFTVDDFLQIFNQREIEKCNKCGMTEAEFKQTGRFGCSQCYDSFNFIMENIVYRYHGSNLHIGKRPKVNIPKKEKLKILKLKYAKALELEDYKGAEALKSQIDDLSTSE